MAIKASRFLAGIVAAAALTVEFSLPGRAGENGQSSMAAVTLPSSPKIPDGNLSCLKTPDMTIRKLFTHAGKPVDKMQLDEAKVVNAILHERVGLLPGGPDGAQQKSANEYFYKIPQGEKVPQGMQAIIETLFGVHDTATKDPSQEAFLDKTAGDVVDFLLKKWAAQNNFAYKAPSCATLTAKP